jgi:hypothetical protein
MRIPRSRGAVSGVLLIILGLFGALIALVGPYFDFTIGADEAWNFGEGHVWLSIVPGVAVVIGAFVLLRSANRATAGLGAWLALLGGAWFVVGEQISQLWNDGVSIAGEAAGGTGQRVAEQLAYFDGLGVLIVAIAGIALGRLAVRSVRDVELAREAEIADRDVDGDVDVDAPRTRESGRFDREETVVAGPATTTASTDGTTTRTDTLSAADHVRDVAGDDDRPTRRL